MTETNRQDELSHLSQSEQQAICSHDAPAQKPGTECVRCGKLLPCAPVSESAAAPEPVRLPVKNNRPADE